MSQRWNILPTLLAGLFVPLLLAGARADRATLRIRVDRPGIRVSPLLYGIFFEEINHAGDGGLYAELVRNRAFEDAAAPEGWSLVSDGRDGKITLDTDRPINTRTPHALRLDIAASGSGRAGVANGGYWGIAARKGASYRLSMFARCNPGFSGPLTVSLESAEGKIYALGKIRGLSEEWKRFETTIKANATDPSARLVITVNAPGTIWLDVVSLFPRDTWKGRAYGLRPDLARLVHDMKPAFIRFPGGCFVEGDRLANAFRWKQTVGDISERPGHANLWGYRSTDGLGYHEYLQMCEDMGAEPLFVINCGMAHADTVPMGMMDEWVQDALDALEYANGPVSSRWGALRAKNGHPKPFDLKYMEVGNENGGPAYEERYALFYDAVKAKYPQVVLVSNLWGGKPSSRPVEILDEHYYSSPEWFASQANRYDRYDRGGMAIYVGEYAVTQGCGMGNLRAGLGEAAFMVGMERNADVVKMASYAPLFVNTNDRKWNPDAIVFDSARSHGTPSYHVQKLFSNNRPDVILPVELKTETLKPARRGGAIGVGTWLTRAEFKDIQVSQDGKTLLSSDFRDGTGGWRFVPGEQGRAGLWSVEEGALRQLSDAPGVRAVAGDPTWSDYTLTLKARKLGGAEGFLILFRTRDDANWTWWNLGGWGNDRHALEQSIGGAKTILGGSFSGRIETGRWYDIRIECRDDHIRCYLDGRLVHDVEDRGPESVFASAGFSEKTGEVIVKIVNMAEAAQDTDIVLEGAEEIAAQGTVTVLTGSPMDENSLEHPLKVAPITSRATGLGKSFRHRFPPHSLTVLRLKTQR